jgi:hypothetical protein
MKIIGCDFHPSFQESVSPATTATAARHLFGRSSACALPGPESCPRLPATARVLAWPADARTTTCSRAASRTAWFSFPILGSRSSSNKSNSSRRWAVQPVKASSSSSFLPAAIQSLCFCCNPLVQGQMLQLVLHLPPHPHQLVPMQQQLPQASIPTKTGPCSSL